MLKWNDISGAPVDNNYVVYAGEQNQKREKEHMLGWRAAGNLVDKLY